MRAFVITCLRQNLKSFDRYVLRAKDAGARREMWVVLHAYTRSSTRGPRVSECPNDLVIRSRRDLAS